MIIRFKLLHQIKQNENKVNMIIEVSKTDKIYLNIIKEGKITWNDFVNFHVNMSLDDKESKDKFSNNDFKDDKIIFICIGGVFKNDKNILLSDLKKEKIYIEHNNVLLVNVYSRNKDMINRLKNLYISKGKVSEKIIYNTVPNTNNQNIPLDKKLEEVMNDEEEEIDDNKYIEEANKEFVNDFSNPKLRMLCSIIHQDPELLEKANQYFSSGYIEFVDSNVDYNSINFDNFKYLDELKTILENIEQIGIVIDEKVVKYYLNKYNGFIGLTLRTILHEINNTK